MKNRNIRRVSMTVTAQTLYHLNKLAAMSGYKNIGRVVDKLVREKVVSLHPDRNENTCVCCGAPIPEGRLVCPLCEKGADRA